MQFAVAFVELQADAPVAGDATVDADGATATTFEIVISSWSSAPQLAASEALSSLRVVTLPGARKTSAEIDFDGSPVSKSSSSSSMFERSPLARMAGAASGVGVRGGSALLGQSLSSWLPSPLSMHKQQ